VTTRVGQANDPGAPAPAPAPARAPVRAALRRAVDLVPPAGQIQRNPAPRRDFHALEHAP